MIVERVVSVVVVAVVVVVVVPVVFVKGVTGSCRYFAASVRGVGSGGVGGCYIMDLVVVFVALVAKEAPFGAPFPCRILWHHVSCMCVFFVLGGVSECLR